MLKLIPVAPSDEPPQRRSKAPSTGLIDLAVTGLDHDALADLEAFISGLQPRRSDTPLPPKLYAQPATEEWIDPFYAAHEETLRTAVGARLTFDEATWTNEPQSPIGLDIEVYENFFLVCFKRFTDGKRITFEMSERAELDHDALRKVMASNLLVSFNGITYDVPLIYYALGGADNAKLKTASDRIIKGNMKAWEVDKELGITIPRLNHIDLVEPNPSIRQGLKLLNGRLHGRYMVDLPYDPDTRLTPEQMNVVTLYCFNDIDATQLLYDAMREPLDLRIALSREYRIDLRSKSDAQIGETLVKKRVESALKRRLGKGNAEGLSVFSYDPPDFIKFNDARLTHLLGELRTTKFTLDKSGKVVTPSLLENLEVRLGQMTYSMGIGGLHSTEEHRALHSDNERVLVDVDVASQYPNIVVKLGLYPKAMGPTFLTIYKEMIADRLAAKASGDKIRAEGGKIMLNGQVGKFGSLYSPLYAPHLFIGVTLTGQLSILMLIERAEEVGIAVVSANTDGVLFHCPRGLEGRLNDLLASWETETGLVIEKNHYRSIYNSSVNTYIAIREDGKVKRKGWIADPWKDGDLRGQMMKNPQMTVCSEAVLQYALNETPIEQTIRQCRDPRAFITVIKVNGGGQWRGHPLGRAVRYYWSTNGDPIYYADGSRKVAKTDGAKPMLELVADTLPNDIDYTRYIEEAKKLATDLGIGALL